MHNAFFFPPISHAHAVSAALALDSTTALSVSTATLHVGAITAICLHLRFILTPTSRGLRLPIKASHLLRSIPTPLHQQPHTPSTGPGFKAVLTIYFSLPPQTSSLSRRAPLEKKKRREEKKTLPSMCSIFPSHSVIGVSSSQAAGGGGFQSPESRASSMSSGSGGGGSLPSPSGPACSRSWWAFYSETKTISHSIVSIFFFPFFSLFFIPRYIHRSYLLALIIAYRSPKKPLFTSTPAALIYSVPVSVL
jgi:hypothetical protein